MSVVKITEVQNIYYNGNLLLQMCEYGNGKVLAWMYNSKCSERVTTFIHDV